MTRYGDDFNRSMRERSSIRETEDVCARMNQALRDNGIEATVIVDQGKFILVFSADEQFPLPGPLTRAEKAIADMIAEVMADDEVISGEESPSEEAAEEAGEGEYPVDADALEGEDPDDFYNAMKSVTGQIAPGDPNYIPPGGMPLQMPYPESVQESYDDDDPRFAPYLDRKFKVSVTYQTALGNYDEESGEFDEDSGYEMQDEVMDFDDVVQELRNGGFFEMSSSRVSDDARPAHLWISTEESQDSRTGASTVRSMHITDLKGKDITGHDWHMLTQAAGIRI